MTADTLSRHGFTPPTRARAMVAGGLAPLPGIPLAAVLATAELQTRTDRKYLLPYHLFPELVAGLDDRFRVLEIDRRRLFGYESVYFDTPDRRLYRQHLQGRRLRYKVRTRTYLDSGECMFEVKLKGGRSQTVKARRPHRLQDRTTVTGQARGFLDDLLTSHYDLTAPPLQPAVTTAYTRSTLVDPERGARLTCDVDLRCTGRGKTVAGAAGSLLIESKTGTGGSTADRILRDLGIRPIKVSKYCLGVALLDPTVPANPWNRTLRRHFDWHRHSATDRPRRLPADLQ